uniref:Conotoxin VnMKLT2-013 n=1 Tax=Conus ventricosus TaxID=117992 RepID=O1618_CONVE|nr:RecName: Full=Conotoxin VnMKLT2-013; Flags: Precursor [Conus ventricosus]AAG60473.1 conotoxin scaffold VI/VII precursor [Conus ventricosus]
MMKLTCVLIIAVLFLTACQLTTAETRDEYRAVRSSDEVQNSRSTDDCSTAGCKNVPCCEGLVCTGPSQGPVCQPLA